MDQAQRDDSYVLKTRIVHVGDEINLVVIDSPCFQVHTRQIHLHPARWCRRFSNLNPTLIGQKPTSYDTPNVPWWTASSRDVEMR
jgi:hypothetical protein